MHEPRVVVVRPDFSFQQIINQQQDYKWKICCAETSGIFLKGVYKIKGLTLNMYTFIPAFGRTVFSNFFLLFSPYFHRKPLISCVEKQLLGEHMTAMLQKGKSV